MIEKIKLHWCNILVAIFVGFIITSVLRMWLLPAQSVFMSILIASCTAAIVSASLIHKRFSADLSALSDNIDNVAIGTAEISYSLDRLQHKISVQSGLSNDSATIIHQVSINSAQLSTISQATIDAAGLTDAESRQGQRDLEIIIQKIHEMNLEAKRSSNAVNQLVATTKKIEKITEVVQGVASVTNLLSINAAIQAAHAGDQGKGFAVIASEIRQLSKQTSQAISEISAILEEIQLGTKDSAASMESLTHKVDGIVDSSGDISKILAGISATAISTELQTREMANSLEEHVNTTEDISNAVLSVKDNLDVIAIQSKQTSDQSFSLTGLSETIHATLFKFGITQSRHTRIRLMADKQIKAIQKVFETAIANGQLLEEDLFDQNYQPIPHTNPQKYHTKFDQFTDSVLPALQEPLLKEHEGIVFVIATDVNGYVPTHNERFSYAPTGNYEMDLVKSRSKRIFTDPVGRRCGSHTESFLLQTYKRDTGEVMHDLSVPLYINGKHWGGVRVGYLAGYNQTG